MYFASFGHPIYSPDKVEIWAYWNKNLQSKSPTFKFQTMSGFLNVPTIIGNAEFLDVPSFRNTHLYCQDGTWYAGIHCVQKDFADNPLFVLSPLTGPETVATALKVILNDSGFRLFFGDPDTPMYGGDGSNIYQKLEMFRDYNESRRRKHSL